MEEEESVDSLKELLKQAASQGLFFVLDRPAGVGSMEMLRKALGPCYRLDMGKGHSVSELARCFELAEAQRSALLLSWSNSAGIAAKQFACARLAALARSGLAAAVIAPDGAEGLSGGLMKSSASKGRDSTP